MENTTSTQPEFYGISYCLKGEYFLLMQQNKNPNQTHPFIFMCFSSHNQIVQFLINTFTEGNFNNLKEKLQAFNSLNPFIVKFNISSVDEINQQLLKYHDGSNQIVGIHNKETNHELFGLRVKPSINEIKILSINITTEHLTEFNHKGKQIPLILNPFNPDKKNLA